MVKCPSCGSRKAENKFIMEKILPTEIIAYESIGCPDCGKQTRKMDAKPIVLMLVPLE